MRSPLLTTVTLLALTLLLVSPSLVQADDVDTSHLPTYYDLLELPTTATPSELKRSYRRLALIHHPDKATSPSDRSAKEATFIQLSDAYEVLSSASLRPRYDHLLTQRVHVYSDTARDWASFNPETGRFDRKRGEVVFGDGRFSFGATRSWEDARERWEREKVEEEREKQALLLALAGSVVVALLPLGWFYAQRLRAWWLQAKRKGEASEKLRGEQAVLAEWQEEKKREEQRSKEEHKARVAEIRRLREAAARAAEAATEAEAEDEEDSEVTSSPSEPSPVPGAGAGGESPTADEAQVVAAAADADEEEEDERPRKGGGGGGGRGVVLSCDECRKQFKSSAQLDNHLLSNQHKKAIKEAERREARKR